MMTAFDAICDGEQGSLIEAAFEFAQDEYPHLEPANFLSELQHLSEQFRSRLRPGQTSEEILARLGEFFFGEQGYCGNTEEYYDPRNSYLCDVLKRKVGIPISLSVIYQHLALSAGLELVGVNFPGHFLLAFEEDGARIYIDVFHGGRLLTWHDCLERLRPGDVDALLFECEPPAMSDRDILVRMLRNLKGIYSRSDFPRCLRVQERICQLRPEDPSEMRDLGILYFHTGKPILALQTLDKVVEKHPDFREREVVDSYRKKAANQAVLLN